VPLGMAQSFVAGRSGVVSAYAGLPLLTLDMVVAEVHCTCCWDCCSHLTWPPGTSQCPAADLLFFLMGAADVLSILPFGNLIFVVAVTAEQLYDSLENWVSGLSVYYNPWGVFGQARPYLHH
jgi:hypothetical protein